LQNSPFLRIEIIQPALLHGHGARLFQRLIWADALLVVGPIGGKEIHIQDLGSGGRGGRGGGARDPSIRPLMKMKMNMMMMITTTIIIIVAQVLAFLPLLIRAQEGFDLLTWNVSYQSLTILGSTPKKVEGI
jgi:hypothetical protein